VSEDSQEVFAREKLVAVLADVDSPVGLRALASGLIKRTPKTRDTILHTLDPGWGIYPLMEFNSPSRSLAKTASLSPATQAAMEDLLAGELNDDFLDIGQSGSTDGVSISGLRLCDFAALILSTRWPELYHFDMEASFSIRERERVTALNTWRKSRGMESLPVPAELPKAAPRDRGKVVQVIFAGADLDIPDAAKKRIEAAAGRTFNSALFRDLLSVFKTIVASIPLRQSGFAIDAFRGNDGTGVTLVIRTDERFGTKGESHPWTPLVNMAKVAQTYSGQLDEGLAELEAYPLNCPLTFEMEFAPDRYAEDEAL